MERTTAEFIRYVLSDSVKSYEIKNKSGSSIHAIDYRDVVYVYTATEVHTFTYNPAREIWTSVAVTAQ